MKKEMDEKDLLWNYYADQRLQGRAFDTQRTSLGNFVITISSALIAFYGSDAAEKPIIPLAFIVTISLFGLVATLIFHSRQKHHFSRAHRAFDRLDQLLTEGKLKESVVGKGDTRIKSYMVWVALHGIFFVSGLVLSLYEIFGKP